MISTRRKANIIFFFIFFFTKFKNRIEFANKFHEIKFLISEIEFIMPEKIVINIKFFFAMRKSGYENIIRYDDLLQKKL